MGGLVITHEPRKWITRLAVVPVAMVAWLGVGTGAALAAPSDHGPAAATSANPNANLGVGNGNGNGNGNAKHDPSDASTPSAPTDSTTAPAASTGSADTHQTTGTAGTSGDPTQPQPNSNADNKGAKSGGNSANGQCPGGPYCSTRDGSPSGNGNGKGKAVGKPCAGCVGKADNKNPKGQNPNGSDHNAGYECDRNHGIGQTNPAHTGCKSSTPPPTCVAPSTMINGVCTPPCAAGQTRVNGVCTSSENCPEGEHLSNGTCVPDDDCVPSAANHNCTPTPPCTAPAEAGPDGTCVLGEKKTRKPTSTPTHKPTTSVLGEKVTRLPFTGMESAWMVETGLGALAIGALMLVAGGRRRRQRV